MQYKLNLNTVLYTGKETWTAETKLDAKEEIRSKRRTEQKVVVDKGVNKFKRIMKWIIAFALWIFAIACFGIMGSRGIVYLPIGLLKKYLTYDFLYDKIFTVRPR